jgi:5-methylcytosine-specific restriction endonuclease McrA
MILHNRKVLILNKLWMPIAVVTLQRALTILFSTYETGEPKAYVVDVEKSFAKFTWEDWAKLIPHDGEATIHSVKNSFRIPEIVLLSRYNKLPQQRIRFSRRTIYRRDANTCQYCGDKPGTEFLSVDHILPRSRGGITSWDNCCLACTKCNKRKADRTPKECGMKLLKKPVKPRFTFYKGDYRCDSWQAILGEVYWSVELQHDMGYNA